MATIFGGGALWVAIYGTFVLNFCDFTRNAKTKSRPSSVATCSVSRSTCCSSVASWSSSPVAVQDQRHRSSTSAGRHRPDDPEHLLLVLACLALIILTIAVNLMANFVAPVYVLANLFPRHLNFRRAGLGQRASSAWSSCPGTSTTHPLVIEYFLGGARRHPRAAVRRDHGRLLADPQRPRSTCRSCTRGPGRRPILQARHQPPGHHRADPGSRDRDPRLPSSPPSKPWRRSPGSSARALGADLLS